VSGAPGPQARARFALSAFPSSSSLIKAEKVIVGIELQLSSVVDTKEANETGRGREPFASCCFNSK